jgi:putative peptidoglycan binding protein
MVRPVQNSSSQTTTITSNPPVSTDSKQTSATNVQSNPTPQSQPMNGTAAVEKKAEHSMTGASIASDLNRKAVNPNAPALESIEKGGAVARQGQTGESVKDVQRALNREGATPALEENGKFDANTEARVKEFQKKNNLPEDGRVGKETLAKLVPNADAMEKDPKLAKLDPAVRNEVMDRARKSSASDRAHLLDVTTAPGFEKLAPAQQKEMLNVWDKGPNDKGLSDDLRKMAGSENFQKLDPSIQSLGLTQLGKNAADPSARETLVKLQTTNGFKKLDPSDQERLLTMVGGSNEKVSKPAREALAETMKDWKTDGDTDAQANGLKQFLKDQKWEDWHTPAGAWNGRTSKPDSVTGPEKVESGPFRLEAGAADKYTVKYGTKEIPVFVPAGTPKKDVDQLISTMDALPKANRQLIKQVVMEKKDDTSQNPPPFFDALNGTVRAYPSGVALDPPERRMSAMVHESAHLIDAHLQKKIGPQWDKDWHKAIEDDKLVGSQYGKKSEGEDFAEAYLLYKLSKGKPEFDEYRQMFPNRWKQIDEIEKQADAGTL